MWPDQDDLDAALRGDDVGAPANAGRIIAGLAVLLAVTLFAFLAVAFAG